MKLPTTKQEIEEARMHKDEETPTETVLRPIGLKIYGIPEKLVARLMYYGIAGIIGSGSFLAMDGIRSHQEAAAPASSECQCAATLEPRLKELETDVRHLSDAVSKMQGTMEAFMTMQGIRRTSIDVPGGYDTIATLQTNLDRLAQ
jgi:hypothetical protein